MPITTAYAPITYSGNGVTASFTVSWPYQFDTDIVAKTQLVSTGAITTLALGTDFAVNPIANSPAEIGALTLLGGGSALPTGTNLIISRAVPVTQETSWVPNDPNPSTATMNAVDKLTMIVQDDEANPFDPGGDTSTFVRGDGSLSNTLIGALGAAVVPSDVQTVMESNQNGAAAYKVTAGAGAQSSYRFAMGGSSNPWEMQLVYDPNITAWGWQAFGGAIIGTFAANGNVSFPADLSVGATVNASTFIGAADASLITTGVIDVARLGSGSGNASTFLNGVGVFTTPAGGGGINTTTTGTFVIAAVNSTQTVPVTDATGIVAGTYLQISDGTHTIIGVVTVVASLNLTVKTTTIVLGSAGNTMASGAAVQAGLVGGTNSILITDAATAPTSMTTMQMAGSTADWLNNGPGGIVRLFAQNQGGGTQAIDGYIPFDTQRAEIFDRSSLVSAGVIAYAHVGNVNTDWLQPTALGQVLACSSFSGGIAHTIAWGLIGPTNITPASLTPALLNCTNALTDTQAFTYDSASGHFKMAAVPLATGNASQLINGAGTPVNALLATGTFNNFSIGDTSLNYLTIRGGGSGANPAMSVSTAASGGANDYTNGMTVNFPIYTGSSFALIDSLPSFNTFPIEGGVFQNWIRASVGVRTAAGTWANTSLHNAPTSTLTIDVNTSAYHRITGMTGNCTVTITDTTPVPSNSSYRYAGEMIVEIVAPGSNTITWAAASGSITWVGGGSAPTLSTSGTTVIRFTRRQGVSGWLGSVDVATSGTTYTDAQARAAVLSSTYLIDSSTIAMNVVAGTSATTSVKAGSIGNTQLASGIQASKLQGYPTDATKFLNGAGGWTVPSGGGGSFSPGTSYVWTAPQVYNSSATIASAGDNTFTGTNTFSSTYNKFSRTLTGGGTGSATVQTLMSGQYTGSGSTGPLYQDGNAIDVTLNDAYIPTVSPVGAGMGVAFYNHVITGRTLGGESIHHAVDVQSTTASGFNISHTIFTQGRRMNGGVIDAVWLSSFSPDSTYSGSNNPITGVHDLFNTGLVRVGEFNYGNAWADFGRLDSITAGRLVSGPWLVPDWLGNNSTNHHYNASFALVIAAAGPDFFFVSPKNWVGVHMEVDSIVGVDSTGTPANYGTGGWGLNVHGGSSSTVAAAAALRAADCFDVGIDLSAATITAEPTSTHSNKAAIQLASGQAICFKAPTGANTGVYIWFDGTNLKATKVGGQIGASTVTIV